MAVQGEDGYELTDGSWWVWQEGDTTYLYTNLEETAHPAAIPLSGLTKAF